MAFPTIPTTAAGRIISANIAGTGTRTFPNLNTLTSAAGDLLIAIAVAYQSSSGAGAPGGTVFSSWGGGFTEFCDQMTTNSSTCAIGAAWKTSSGSETGTFTVTQAATITGDASLMVLAIPGGYTTSAPEVGTIANGTSAAADPGSLDPSGWGTEDTLWIAVHVNGMTSGTGSWTGTGSTAPTNYGNLARTSTVDNSTVGQVELAVAFRQNRASSEDVGTFSGTDVSNARNSQLTIAVRPAFTRGAVVLPLTYGSTSQSPRYTSRADISLASGATPRTRTSHAISVKARVQSGTGTLYAQLFEGGVARSAILSQAMTTSLATYSLAISNTDAATITSYMDLDIKVWGISPTEVTFEVAELSLTTPLGGSYLPEVRRVQRNILLRR